MEFKLINNCDLTDDIRNSFGELLNKQEKVQGNTFEKADRCKTICLVKRNYEIIGIGAIKPKTNTSFLTNKANIPKLSSQFSWELGYLFVEIKYKGRGIGKKIVEHLIQYLGDENLMASTEYYDNTPMVRILEANNFKQTGQLWSSAIHGKKLGLFLKTTTKHYPK